MKHFVSENPVGVVLTLLAISLTAAVMGSQGCDLSRMVKVSVPQGMQAALNVPPKATLADCQNILDDFRAWSNRQTETFADSVESGWRWFGFFQSAMRIGLAEAGAAGVGAIPFGGLALSLLMGTGGLFMRKPGTDRMVASEKRASYNKGLKEGRNNTGVTTDG